MISGAMGSATISVTDDFDHCDMASMIATVPIAFISVPDRFGGPDLWHSANTAKKPTELYAFSASSEVISASSKVLAI